MNDSHGLPVLYSLRNCPYAMRARLALYRAKQKVILRSVVLSNKPSEMLAASPKGTVPVLILPSNNTLPRVIDESLELMLWALNQNDPDDLLHQSNANKLTKMLAVIALFDTEFKLALDRYKCAKRYHHETLFECRQACQQYLNQLEQRLNHHGFLMSGEESLVDLALLPYIRQFARVERHWYLQSPYPNLRKWLNSYLQGKMFSKVMTKYPIWSNGSETVIFGGN